VTDTARSPRLAGLGQRLDKISLRWQARLDTEWSDRVLPWLVALVVFLVFAALALARARSLEDGVDLGIYTQAAWLIGRGSEPTITLERGLHFLAHQASFLFYPVALLTRLLPTIPTLLVVQSATLALGVVPLWRIARRVALLRVGAAATLLFAYAMYPAVQNLNLNDFHPEVAALPALLAAALYGLTTRWIPFALCCVVTVACRADLGLAVFGLGLLLVGRGERRAGTLTAVAGLGWTLLAVFAVQPAFGDGGYAHIDAFIEYGDSPLDVLAGMITHPFQVLGDLFVEENFTLLIFLFAPVLFLPLLAPRYLLPVVPLEILYLVADVPEQDVFGSQTVAISAFIFVATALALARTGTMGVEKVRVDRRVLGALILASTVFFVADADSSPYREPWRWGGRDVVDQARLEAVELIDDDAAVRATPEMIPLLAERTEVFELATDQRPHVRRAIDGVDVIVVDAMAVPGWSDEERRLFREGLARQGYTRVFSREGVEVYEGDGQEQG
jgi:uncharacterized membrane protein